MMRGKAVLTIGGGNHRGDWMADENAVKTPGARPDYRIVQPMTDREGKPYLKSVGGVWANKGKDGKTFYTMKIGDLRLLMFVNDKLRPAKPKA